jgi:hypothetical protein
MSESDEDREALRAALELLAAPPELQMQHLDALREVAAATLAPPPDEPPRIDVGLHRRKLIPDSVMRLIEEIDATIALLLEEADPFSPTLLEASSDWKEVRVLARRALMALR